MSDFITSGINQIFRDQSSLKVNPAELKSLSIRLNEAIKELLQNNI